MPNLLAAQLIDATASSESSRKQGRYQCAH
jgi:hypothetical protein